MICQYHEVSALVGVGRPGRPVVLNDLHKAAWGFYTGTGKMEIPDDTERPFTFRGDALPGRPGMFLLTVRSPFTFANARARSVALYEGSELHLELVLSPFKREKNAQGKTRRVVPPEEEWLSVAAQRFRACGLEPGEVTLTRLPSMAMRPRQVRHPLLVAEATAVVADPMKATDAWLNGGTPMRAYGLGQLTLLPDSPTQAVAA